MVLILLIFLENFPKKLILCCFILLSVSMIESCKSYQDLPEEDPREGNRRTVKGSKRARPFNLSEVESESPVKRTYVIDDDSTSDEEAASAAAS